MRKLRSPAGVEAWNGSMLEEINRT
jgi:hypothetical protein